MPAPLRAVSLDLDNTLWDTPPVLLRAEAALALWLRQHAPGIAARFSVAEFQQQRAALARAEPERAHDMSWLRTETLRRAAAAAGYPAAVADQAFEEFLRERNSIERFVEVDAALDRLARCVPLFAVTNGNACVRRVGIGRFFAGSVDAAGAGVAKPDARIFKRLIELAAMPAEQILHVGDDAIADVNGAQRAGLKTVWMNRAGAEWPAELPRADHEVADLDALAALVERLS